MTQYKVLTGIDYPPNKRAEAGSIVSDLPEKSAKWLLDQGLIELAGGKTSTAVPIKEEPTEEIIEIAKEEKPPYVPEAKDGDNDGFIQDGTKWERPVGTELTDEELSEKLESDK
jgi:hypothetical protein